MNDEYQRVLPGLPVTGVEGALDTDAESNPMFPLLCALQSAVLDTKVAEHQSNSRANRPFGVSTTHEDKAMFGLGLLLYL
jgi:hypothetical protein